MEKPSDSGISIERYVQSEPTFEERDRLRKFPESRLRPKTFDDYPGQYRVKNNLKVYVHAAKQRNDTQITFYCTGPRVLGRRP